jgi:sarcosine oxidase, subunit delta
MSYRINCPICGARDVYEFRFGGEDRGPKTFDENVDSETWCEYIHLRTNSAAPKKEWWYHRDGCATWFSIWRDPTINREVTVPKEEK